MNPDDMLTAQEAERLRQETEAAMEAVRRDLEAQKPKEN